MTSSEIRDYIIHWNVRFPIDRWWRKKYNIAFNSLSHRESNFIDQLIEWEEDQLFSELANREDYIPNQGDWLKTQEYNSDEETLESLKRDFENLLEEDKNG